MGAYLTSSSTLMCPHGGSAVAVPSNTAATLGGDPILLASDTFQISSCTFNVSGSPHPCMEVKWIVTTLRASAGGAEPLTMDSVGLCVAADQAVQGSVMIQATQSPVSGL